MLCVMDMAREIADFKRSLDRDEPGWMETTFWCPVCREQHVLVSEAKQLQLEPGHVEAGRGHPHRGAPTRHLPPVKPGAPEGWCRWHKTASPELSAPCAWETCRTAVHVHRDALGQVKSGRAGKGYLVERCPACHRYNAIHPVYGKNAIRASKLEGDVPVLQLNMRSIG